MDTSGSTLFWFVVPGFVAPALCVALAFWSPTRWQLGRWADASGVTVTPANEQLVRSHLGRVRRFRALAAFPFWWLGTARLVFPSFPEDLATYSIPLLVYVGGALLAEVTFAPDPSGSIKQASLTPRTVRDYQPDWIRVLAPIVLVVSAVLLALPIGNAAATSRRGAVIGLVLATAVVALSRVAAQRIVRRPQRGDDIDVLAADDGLRATAVSMTTSIAVMASLTAFMPALLLALSSGNGRNGPLAVALLVPLYLVAMGSFWCIVRQETWGYPRRFRQPIVADAA